MYGPFGDDLVDLDPEEESKELPEDNVELQDRPFDVFL